MFTIFRAGYGGKHLVTLTSIKPHRQLHASHLVRVKVRSSYTRKWQHCTIPSIHPAQRSATSAAPGTATQADWPHWARLKDPPPRDPGHIIGCTIVWGALGSINWEQRRVPFFLGGLHHFKTCTERLKWPILISCMQTSKNFEFKSASARIRPR